MDRDRILEDRLGARMIRVLVISLLLTGCVAPPIESYDPSYTDPLPITNPETMVVGDSLCDSDYNLEYTWPELNGFHYDCKFNRKMTYRLPSHFYEPNEFENVVLALGVNDAGRGVPIEEYRTRLLDYLTYDDAEYWCILPYTRHEKVDAEPYRQVMLSECVNTFDPSTLPLVLSDVVHYTAGDSAMIAAPEIKAWIYGEI